MSTIEGYDKFIAGLAEKICDNSKTPYPTHPSERYYPPWCVWDHRKKCPEEKYICGSDEQEHCEHFHNVGGNNWLNINNPNSHLYQWARDNKNPLVKED